MNVNNLRNYNWEQGTQDSPVLLTGAEFNKLTALIEESNKLGSNINIDIRGWVKVGQHITSYQLYLAELAKDGQGNPLLHVVNTVIDPITYSVNVENATINEGTSTRLFINGIDKNALKFRIVSHSNENPDYQARTTIDNETDSQYCRIRVAEAQENTTWDDIVIIQCCPIWEEFPNPESPEAKIITVTANAVGVNSAIINAPDFIKPGVRIYANVNFIPNNHTKPVTNDPLTGVCFVPTSDNFEVSKSTNPNQFTIKAPNSETPDGQTWKVYCAVYGFNNASTIATINKTITSKYPYIQFTVTTDGTFSDISSANPKITLQKVDSEDTPIGEPIVLTGQSTPPPPSEPTSLVYTYGNGNVAGDGSETYKVTFDAAPEGYKNIQQMAITPNQVITEIAVQYVVKKPGIYVIYSDGYIELAQDIIDRNYSKISKTPVGVLFETEVDGNSVSFIVPNVENVIKAKVNDGKGLIFLDNIGDIQGCTKTSNKVLAVTDFNGDENRDAILAHYANHADYNSNNFLTRIWYETTITISGTVLRGHPCTLGEKVLVKDNSGIIGNIFVNYFGWPSSYTFWKTSRTSTLFSTDSCWTYGYGSDKNLGSAFRSGSDIFDGADESFCCMTYKR